MRPILAPALLAPALLATVLLGARHAGSSPPASIDLPDRPFGIAVSREGTVLVTQLDARTVSVVDVAARRVTARIAVGSVPTGVVFAPDGRTAWVTNQHSGEVGLIDVSRRRQVATLAVPGNPFVVGLGPDARTLYVASSDDVLTVFDVATRRERARLPMGPTPNSYALAPDRSRAYVGSAHGASVAELDPRSLRVTRRFIVEGTPQEIVVSWSGCELYVANEAGWVDVIDIGSGEVVHRVPLAGGGFGMALSPDGQHLYVTVPSRGLVHVIDTERMKVVRDVGVGGRPRRVAFLPGSRTAVVANEAGRVDVIR